MKLETKIRNIIIEELCYFEEITDIRQRLMAEDAAKRITKMLEEKADD